MTSAFLSWEPCLASSLRRRLRSETHVDGTVWSVTVPNRIPLQTSERTRGNYDRAAHVVLHVFARKEAVRFATRAGSIVACAGPHATVRRRTGHGRRSVGFRSRATFAHVLVAQVAPKAGLRAPSAGACACRGTAIARLAGCTRAATRGTTLAGRATGLRGCVTAVFVSAARPRDAHEEARYR